jgi:hypothetical protein
MNVRGALVRIGRTLLAACAFVVNRRASGGAKRQHAVDALRRQYVFGAMGRQAFEDGLRKLGGNAWRRFRRKSRNAA